MFRWVNGMQDFPDAKIEETKEYNINLVINDIAITSAKEIVELFTDRRNDIKPLDIRIIIPFLDNLDENKKRNIETNIENSKNNKKFKDFFEKDPRKMTYVKNFFTFLFKEFILRETQKDEFITLLKDFGYYNILTNQLFYIQDIDNLDATLKITKFKYNMNSKMKNKCTLKQYHNDNFGGDCQYMGLFHSNYTNGTATLWRRNRNAILLFNIPHGETITNMTEEIYDNGIEKDIKFGLYNVPIQKSDIKELDSSGHLGETLRTIKGPNTVPNEHVLVSNSELDFILIELIPSSKFSMNQYFMRNPDITMERIMNIIINNISNLDNFSILTNFIYIKSRRNPPVALMRQKYLKYKMKYLELKMKNINL